MKRDYNYLYRLLFNAGCSPAECDAIARELSAELAQC